MFRNFKSARDKILADIDAACKCAMQDLDQDLQNTSMDRGMKKSDRYAAVVEPILENLWKKLGKMFEKSGISNFITDIDLHLESAQTTIGPLEKETFALYIREEVLKKFFDTYEEILDKAKLFINPNDALRNKRTHFDYRSTADADKATDMVFNLHQAQTRNAKLNFVKNIGTIVSTSSLQARLHLDDMLPSGLQNIKETLANCKTEADQQKTFESIQSQLSTSQSRKSLFRGKETQAVYKDQFEKSQEITQANNEAYKEVLVFKQLVAENNRRIDETKIIRLESGNKRK